MIFFRGVSTKICKSLKPTQQGQHQNDTARLGATAPLSQPPHTPALGERQTSNLSGVHAGIYQSRNGHNTDNINGIPGRFGINGTVRNADGSPMSHGGAPGDEEVDFDHLTTLHQRDIQAQLSSQRLALLADDAAVHFGLNPDMRAELHKYTSVCSHLIISHISFSNNTHPSYSELVHNRRRFTPRRSLRMPLRSTTPVQIKRSLNGLR